MVKKPEVLSDLPSRAAIPIVSQPEGQYNPGEYPTEATHFFSSYQVADVVVPGGIQSQSLVDVGQPTWNWTRVLSSLTQARESRSVAVQLGAGVNVVVMGP